jgi:hypothetical protein
MLRYLLLILCISLTYAAFSQEPGGEQVSPCGTPNGISPWLKAYKSNQVPVFSARSEDTLWVAVKVHLLARDNGAGRYPYEKVFESICRLNSDFGPSKIQFYLKDSFNLINNTGWYTHSTIPQGIDMMLSNNVDGALNAYFVNDPAGNCGYNLPYAGVAIKHSCAGPNAHTWAHEAGHALALPHPFIGWEGKTYNYNVPTPTMLTYDYTYFHDSLETQIPAPLDTALVEYVNGSNCVIAADLICDTKPDYLSYRWNCNTQQTSTVKQKDPLGVDFFSDGSLFMSYADDACQNRFSPEEIQVMRANLMTEKADWVAPVMLESPVVSTATAIEPVLDQPVPFSGTTLKWASVPNATYYVVQASRFSSYVLKEVDVLTTDTSWFTGPLVLNKTYYWRVKAYNSRHACVDFNESATFLTAPTTSVYTPDWEGWRCYPSLMAAGQPLQMEIPDSWLGQNTLARIVDAAGKLVWEDYLSLHSKKMWLKLPSEAWQPGMYHFVLTGNRGVKKQTVFIR